jgi:hypothetical protein
MLDGIVLYPEDGRSGPHQNVICLKLHERDITTA